MENVIAPLSIQNKALRLLRTQEAKCFIIREDVLI